jgi:signal transduction histidine kinase/ligand-binding sensor domain-containing protein
MITKYFKVGKMAKQLFFWLVILFSVHLNSQEINLKFDYLNTTNSSISSNRILDILRDHKGFLWIATPAGLNRFDGYSITTFLNDTSISQSLPNNYINSLFEDSKKHLWVSTPFGLCIYSPKKETFKVYKFVNPDELALGNRQVYTTCEDLNNNIWVALGKHGGISKYNSEKDTFTNFRIENISDYNAYNTVYDIVVDKNNILWLSTLGNELVSFNPQNGKFTTVSDPSIDMGTGGIKRLFLDSNNILWILTEGNGLFKFDLTKKVFAKIPVKDDGTGTNGAIIRCMAQYDKTHLLIGVDQGGINVLNTQTGKFEYILYNEFRPRTLSNNGVWSLLKDSEGILWVGTSAAGISYYNPKKERFNHYKHYPDPSSLSYDALLCLYEDNEGKIWIGTDGGGLNILNPKTGKFDIYQHNPNIPGSIASNVILTIDEDMNNNIWMGTWANGLLRYNRITGKFYQYKSSESNLATIGSNNIFSVITDKKNNVLISNYDYGIDIFNEKGFTRKFRYNPIEYNPESFFRINIFCRGQNNKIWIVRGSNISYIDTVTYELKDKLQHIHGWISSFHEDKAENLWVGTTSNGVFCYDKKGNQINFLNTSNGLPNNAISGILEDNSDNLWISTNAGICKYNKINKTFLNYPQNDPIQSNNFKEWVCLKSKSGMMYFGGYNGLTSFYPDSIKDNNYMPYVYINDFQIFGKSVQIGEYDSLLRENISETKRIILPHTLSVFSFAFTAISFTQPEGNLYQYKLEGFDKEWNPRPANRRYVSYTNLDPGEYIFRVKASNNDGVWSDHEAAIEIIILPPWWETWWFKILSITITICVILLLYVKKVTSIKKENELLDKLVKQRTFEISRQNQEIHKQKELLERKNELLIERENKMAFQNEELHAQSEELFNQTKALALSNEQIHKQHNDLEEAYKELSKYRTQLEDIVDERTKELIAAKEKAEESDRLKSSFLANLSHEIRTPLNAIIGFSGLLFDEEITNNEKEKFSEIILRSGDMLLGIINDVIDFSKIEAGQLIVNITEVPLRNIAVQVGDIFNLELKKQVAGITNEISFEIDIPEELLNLTLLTDEIRVMQIIGHLINNALKFTPTGDIIFGCKALKEMGWVEFFVKDTGIGIKKDYHSVIFQRFRKIEENKDKIYRGAGLGLAISSELINLLGGRIHIDSEPGKGSTFSITIPLKHSAPLLTGTSAEPYKQNYPNFKDVNILVAEDDLSNYLFLEKLLKKTGANVFHAFNGKQAVAMAESIRNLHVILMDIKMPEMDGVQALRAIRQKKIDIPVIAQTAHALSDEVIALKQAGFDFYITKPLKSNDLFKCLNTYLNINK